MSFKRKFGLLGALLITSTALAVPSQAETAARANGRCQLKENGYQAYNGYCTVKQKQNGGTSILLSTWRTEIGSDSPDRTVNNCM